MTTTLRRLACLVLLAAALPGCAVVAIGAAGGVAATEIEERDGKFDPLENTQAGRAFSDLVN
ncbi:MAG: hypothetical protein AAFZ09_17970 [Pseudomonadota bacterium]